MKGFHIRVMYGSKLKRFNFCSNEEDDEKAAIEFDKAVKEINRIYKESGRFATENEVILHFSKYGFYRYKS